MIKKKMLQDGRLTDKGNTRIFESIELCISELNQSSQK